MEQNQLVLIRSKIQGIIDATELFNFSEADFAQMKSELPEMKNADRETWLESLVETVSDSLKELDGEIKQMMINTGGQVYEFTKK